jgi:hypothetical protein
MFNVVTSRFNNETRDKNYTYRNKYQFACLYCSPIELSPQILYNTHVFVIEMNNSNNKIEGIGLIKNKPETRYYKVHSDANINRYTYIGNYFINRETIENYNSIFLYLLEKILFKGKSHSKRGLGLTRIPEKLCKNIDLKKEIKKVFIDYFQKQNI